MIMNNISWKDLFFPILTDIQQINKETDTNYVANNNLELANNPEKFNKVLSEIKERHSAALQESAAETLD
jgi:hypothetical protein